MKRHILAALLVLAMLFSVIALNSCDIINSIVNPGTGEQGDKPNNLPGGETVAKYTITYVGGEGATGDAPSVTIGKSGSIVILATNTFVLDGYIFVGWTDGTETYNAGDVFVMPEANVTLTAIWEEAPEIINEITSVVLDNMILTVSGTINSTTAKVCVGTDPANNTGHNYYQDVTVGEDGSFTASFDLNSLNADEGWYNVHALGLDAENNVINVIASLDKIVDGNGNAIAQDSVIEGTYNKIKIVSWDGENGFKSLSFEVDYKEILVDGKPSATNNPFALVEEDGKVYLTFNDEFNGDATDRTFELILTLDDPKDNPATVNAIVTASNLYDGENGNAFSFKVNLTDNVAKNSGWVRFVLKVTEGDVVTHYTIKPYVENHTGDWISLADGITLGDAKYEIGICWSSVFVQVVNP